MTKIRLQDIASQAGVSTATVSRLLNNPDSVANKTRTRIVEAMDMLGYDRPVALQEGTEFRIGVIIPELTNPTFATMAHLLSQEIAGRDAVALIATQTPGAASEPALIESLLASRCKGLIIVSGRHADATSEGEVYSQLRARRIPFVTLNGPLEGVPSFTTDDELAMSMAVTHLVELGHRRITLLNGNPRMFPAAQKERGFSKACQQAGIDNNDYAIISTLYSRQAGGQAALQAVARGATALICASDIMAVGAVSTLRITGYKVPEDISVIGYDGTVFSTDVTPALTTIRQAFPSMCALAVSTLLDLVHGKQIVTEPFVFAPELCVRDSTGMAPVTEA